MGSKLKLLKKKKEERKFFSEDTFSFENWKQIFLKILHCSRNCLENI